ncbi:CDP-glycerol glycerophosphotransferase family protein [Autumnicola psychrophila]|uniref:CDP-glycerol glycerophosphotransferase family protein n=1 Tax=Autumnicola psychrophila TaxID=3075592 RepID=A0ABU3DTV5_9FLAO|nr:CDP-glycerol glycerophosphotransferase family protein [Zunongwangia sp. F225]MDT0687088.1 CDP-glycerol glycerophosphotransferase family protein [Zunongwangia sp. F225]
MGTKIESDRTYKIGFIFLDEIHHIFHFISIATELSKTQKVSILTYPSNHDLLRRSIKELDGDNITVEELPTSAFRAFTDKIKGRELPRKGFWIKKNKKYILQTFDAVVFTDYFHKYLLRDRKPGKTPKLLKFPHGTPGRAYAFNKSQLDFDFQLIIGNFQYRHYKALGLLGNYPALVGYSKLDAVQHKQKEIFFKNNKPIVLYNPHFDPEFSSWKQEGLQILEYFYSQDAFNLIFAPHLHLFQENKGGHSASEIPEKFYQKKNILIDLGSLKSTDMSYLNAADFYLGDVSSQVYEFIISPRPCIFLNPNNLSYKNDINFRFWRCGEVINSAKELNETLAKATADFAKYRTVQKKITEENYYTEEGSTASERGAKAIVSYLDKALA